MKFGYFLSVEAEHDIDEIITYIAQENKVRLKIQAIEDKEERDLRNEQLTTYLAATECPITKCSIDDPVTVVEGGASRVYENSALRGWIERANTNSVDAGEPQSRTALMSLAIYNGYPKFVSAFVSYVREFLNPTVVMPTPVVRNEAEIRKQARLKAFDPKYKEPAPTSVSAPAATLAVNTLKPGGGAGQSGK